MVQRSFKTRVVDTANVDIRANGFFTTLLANADLAANVSFSLPGADGSSGQVLATDGGGNLYFSDSSANTNIYVADTLVSNAAVILEAGDGISLLANADSGIVSFSTSMSNVTSQTIAVDGSANSFTLAKSVSNSHMVLVSYNGLLQGPEEYSVDGTTLTISNSKPLIADSKIEVRYFDFFSLPGTSEGGGGGEYTFQGSVSGYTSGGRPTTTNIIDKFPFSSDSNATDVGDLLAARYEVAGQSSSESGYVSGGTPNEKDTIQKFSFSSDANATDVGNLTQGRYRSVGQSSENNGYTSGGGNPTVVNTIDKFPFSTDANASDVGDLTQAKSYLAGQSSSTSGYSSGGLAPPVSLNVIDKFPFSSDGSAADVGDLTRVSYGPAGQSSDTYGYTSGGFAPGTSYTNIIDKFPFSSDVNATDVGDLTQVRRHGSGQSSTTNGYTSGGSDSPALTTIDKFPFSSDSNASDVGDLTQGRYNSSGQQV